MSLMQIAYQCIFLEAPCPQVGFLLSFGEGDPVLPPIGVLFDGKNSGGRSLERYRRIYFGSKFGHGRRESNRRRLIL